MSRRKSNYLLLLFFIGIVIGMLVKFLETGGLIHGALSAPVGLFSVLCSSIGLWVFIGSMLAIHSQNGLSAALRNLLFFVGVLSGYLTYTWFFLNALPAGIMSQWIIMVLLSAPAGWLIWHSHSGHWFAALCGGLPIGLLIRLGMPFLTDWNIIAGFSMAFACILLWRLPSGWESRFYTLVAALLLWFVFWRIPVLNLFLTGL